MMMEQKTTEFLEQLSSGAPVPGGGGASAAVGAFGAALGLMVANLTVGRKKYAAVEEEILAVRARLEGLRDALAALVDRDAQAFEPLSRAYGLPRNTEEEKKQRDEVMEEALEKASTAPLEIMETVLQSMDLLGILGEKGSALARSDAGVGILFAQAALEGASLNVFINTKMMKDRDRAKELGEQARAMIRAGREKKERVYNLVLDSIQ